MPLTLWAHILLKVVHWKTDRLHIEKCLHRTQSRCSESRRSWEKFERKHMWNVGSSHRSWVTVEGRRHGYGGRYSLIGREEPQVSFKYYSGNTFGKCLWTMLQLFLRLQHSYFISVPLLQFINNPCPVCQIPPWIARVVGLFINFNNDCTFSRKFSICTWIVNTRVFREAAGGNETGSPQWIVFYRKPSSWLPLPITVISTFSRNLVLINPFAEEFH